MSVEQNLTTCCIGKFDGSLCHLSTYSRKKGFIDFCSELSNEEQSLIVRRTYNLIKNITLICFHHKSLLLHSGPVGGQNGKNFSCLILKTYLILVSTYIRRNLLIIYLY